MEEPEDKLDEEILNGVALRPRVNSETQEYKWLSCVIINNKTQKLRKDTYECRHN